MLKILQARLQQYVNCELSDVQAGFRKGRGSRDQITTLDKVKSQNLLNIKQKHNKSLEITQFKGILCLDLMNLTSTISTLVNASSCSERLIHFLTARMTNNLLVPKSQIPGHITKPFADSPLDNCILVMND